MTTCFPFYANDVNVPAEASSTQNILSRSISEMKTIPVLKTKRRLCYQHCYHFQSVLGLRRFWGFN